MSYHIERVQSPKSGQRWYWVVRDGQSYPSAAIDTPYRTLWGARRAKKRLQEMTIEVFE